MIVFDSRWGGQTVASSSLDGDFRLVVGFPMLLGGSSVIGGADAFLFGLDGGLLGFGRRQAAGILEFVGIFRGHPLMAKGLQFFWNAHAVFECSATVQTNSDGCCKMRVLISPL